MMIRVTYNSNSTIKIIDLVRNITMNKLYETLLSIILFYLVQSVNVSFSYFA